MRQLWADQLQNLSTTYNIEPGKFNIILLRFTGMAQSGQTVALTDLGTVRLNNNSTDKINCDAEFLSLAAQQYGGYVEAVSNIGGTFAFSIFLPAGYWWDSKNVFWFGKQDKGYIQLQFPNFTSSLIASGNVTIYASPSAGAQGYWHKILSKQVVNSASSGTITDIISDRNIASLYLKGASSLITNLMLIRDGNTVINGSFPAELAYSEWSHVFQSASTLYITEFMQNKRLESALSNSFSYQYIFGTSGNLQQYYSSLEFDSIRMRLSIAG